MKLRRQVDEHFNIKEWIQLGQDPSLYLGMKLSYMNGQFFTNMADYISAIKIADLRDVPVGRLEEKGVQTPGGPTTLALSPGDAGVLVPGQRPSANRWESRVKRPPEGQRCPEVHEGSGYAWSSPTRRTSLAC